MRFENSGLAGKIIQFSTLENVMKTVEIIRGGQWDWERTTYDHKFENRSNGEVHYLRVQGVAIKGELENPDAEIKLLTPILGHYYYPHGIEYDEEMPDVIVKKCHEKLAQVKELLEEVELADSKTFSAEDITQRLLDIAAVQNIGELHIWNDEAGNPVLSCHLLIDGEDSDAIVKEASDLLRDEFDLVKTTIQINRAPELATEGDRD